MIPSLGDNLGGNHDLLGGGSGNWSVAALAGLLCPRERVTMARGSGWLAYMTLVFCQKGMDPDEGLWVQVNRKGGTGSWWAELQSSLLNPWRYADTVAGVGFPKVSPIWPPRQYRRTVYLHVRGHRCCQEETHRP